MFCLSRLGRDGHELHIDRVDIVFTGCGICSGFERPQIIDRHLIVDKIFFCELQLTLRFSEALIVFLCIIRSIERRIELDRDILRRVNVVIRAGERIFLALEHVLVAEDQVGAMLIVIGLAAFVLISHMKLGLTRRVCKCAADYRLETLLLIIEVDETVLLKVIHVDRLGDRSRFLHLGVTD